MTASVATPNFSSAGERVLTFAEAIRSTVVDSLWTVCERSLCWDSLSKNPSFPPPHCFAMFDSVLCWLTFTTLLFCEKNQLSCLYVRSGLIKPLCRVALSPGAATCCNIFLPSHPQHLYCRHGTKNVFCWLVGFRLATSSDAVDRIL